MKRALNTLMRQHAVGILALAIVSPLMLSANLMAQDRPLKYSSAESMVTALLQSEMTFEDVVSDCSIRGNAALTALSPELHQLASNLDAPERVSSPSEMKRFGRIVQAVEAVGTFEAYEFLIGEADHHARADVKKFLLVALTTSYFDRTEDVSFIPKNSVIKVLLSNLDNRASGDGEESLGMIARRGFTKWTGRDAASAISKPAKQRSTTRPSSMQSPNPSAKWDLIEGRIKWNAEERRFTW